MLVPATVARFFQNEPGCFNAMARVYGAPDIGINKFSFRPYAFKKTLKLGMDEVFLKSFNALIDLLCKPWFVNGTAKT